MRDGGADTYLGSCAWIFVADRHLASEARAVWSPLQAKEESSVYHAARLYAPFLSLYPFFSFSIKNLDRRHTCIGSWTWIGYPLCFTGILIVYHTIIIPDSVYQSI